MLRKLLIIPKALRYEYSINACISVYIVLGLGWTVKIWGFSKGGDTSMVAVPQNISVATDAANT
jgi:hypothetical protein